VCLCCCCRSEGFPPHTNAVTQNQKMLVGEDEDAPLILGGGGGGGETPSKRHKRLVITSMITMACTVALVTFAAVISLYNNPLQGGSSWVAKKTIITPEGEFTAGAARHGDATAHATPRDDVTKDVYDDAKRAATDYVAGLSGMDNSNSVHRIAREATHEAAHEAVLGVENDNDDRVAHGIAHEEHAVEPADGPFETSA
jgi:hypothetical protein